MKPRALCVLGNFTFHVCICVSVRACVHVHHSVCGGQRTTFRKCFFFLRLCGSWGPSLGCESWQQLPLCIEQSCWSSNLYYIYLFILFVSCSVHVSGSTCGSQKTVSRSLFSPSIMGILGILGILGIKLMLEVSSTSWVIIISSAWGPQYWKS